MSPFLFDNLVGYADLFYLVLF